ncbi:dienelactone hydrolase family protein [Yinghuangia seranimata]|uniref:dienelactone hydrolase family protein n=1 Tax=Yinghuangia seranimata TaxID=408067 RepID=UPI00248B0A31|nr:dienelactone hydrolase family protein [Yinghuangia seranimata]MDI2131151.1 dienelactone hydrolase family protein [Yinghuangia seranimata]
MCHEPDARPAVSGPARTALASAAHVTLEAADGASVAAYCALPEIPSGPSVLVLPDNRGLSPFYESVAERLAEQGHPALAIDYFGRTKELFGLTPAGLDADFAAGAAYLRERVGGGDVAALGFCFGGRQALRCAAPGYGFARVVSFYGYPDAIGPAPGPLQLAHELAAPILALWGGADEAIPAAMVAAFDAALEEAGVPHEFVTYAGAPHSFFDGGAPEFADASADAWGRVLAFLCYSRPGTE